MVGTREGIRRDLRKRGDIVETVSVPRRMDPKQGRRLGDFRGCESYRLSRLRARFRLGTLLSGRENRRLNQNTGQNHLGDESLNTRMTFFPGRSVCFL